MQIYRSSFFMLLTLLMPAYTLKRDDKLSITQEGHGSERASGRS